ncbi:MAG: dimethylarginine dimethylaminohydrolase family protein, partial [Acidobacteriota bacterium]
IGRRLEAAGLTVITLPPDPHLPDSTFTEDTAIVLDELAIITNPGVSSRRTETAPIAAVLAHFRPLHWIKDPGTIEGGDVLRIGHRIYVGQGTRTNAEGIRQLTSLTAPFGYTVIPVPLRRVLHLKTCATWLSEQTLLVNPHWLAAPIPGNYQFLEVPADEPWAANTLTIDGTILLPDGFPQTEQLLTANGYQISPIVMDELQKAEAGLTCLSILFEA